MQFTSNCMTCVCKRVWSLTLLHPLFFETNANDVSDSMAYTSADWRAIYICIMYGMHAMVSAAGQSSCAVSTVCTLQCTIDAGWSFCWSKIVKRDFICALTLVVLGLRGTQCKGCPTKQLCVLLSRWTRAIVGQWHNVRYVCNSGRWMTSTLSSSMQSTLKKSASDMTMIWKDCNRSKGKTCLQTLTPWSQRATNLFTEDLHWSSATLTRHAHAGGMGQLQLQMPKFSATWVFAC